MKSKDLEEGFLRYPVASADYAAAPIERPQAFEKARAEDFVDEAGHTACGYTLVNLCSTPRLSDPVPSKMGDQLLFFLSGLQLMSLGHVRPCARGLMASSRVLLGNNSRAEVSAEGQAICWRLLRLARLK